MNLQVNKILTFNQLITTDFPQPKWLVEKLVPFGGLTMISGSPATYKTWFLIYLSICVANGSPVFGKFVVPNSSGVLLIEEEMISGSLKERSLMLTQIKDLPINFHAKLGFKLTEATVNQLISYAKDNNIGLIIFDPLIRVSGAKDENSASEMSGVFNLMQRLTVADLTVVFTHHNRKELAENNSAHTPRGSSDIEAAVDSYLSISRREQTIDIHQKKLREDEEVKPFSVKLTFSDGCAQFELLGEITPNLTKAKRNQEDIIKILKNENTPLNQKILLEKLAGQDSIKHNVTLQKILKQMVEEGIIEKTPGKGTTKYFSLKQDNYLENQKTISI